MEKNDILHFAVVDVDSTMKIRYYLVNRLGFSTSLIAKVKFGGVFLNGKEVHMRAEVKNGDEITVYIPAESGSEIPPLDIPLEILYEDENILAVNKPVGMPTHPSRGNTLPTLAAAVMHYLGKGSVFRAISRLDKDTSGVVIIAKNAYSAAVLGKEMKSGRIIKEYTAHIHGVPEAPHGIIEAPIDRVKEGDIRRTVREDGKYAKTEYSTVNSLPDGSSIVKLRLHTGRTHQIRVHMAHIGHPLVNDCLYSTDACDAPYFLHCHRVSFNFAQRRIDVLSPPVMESVKE